MTANKTNDKQPLKSPLDLAKDKIREAIFFIDDLTTETEKNLAFDYLAGIMITEGYVCVISDENGSSDDFEGPREYNINMLFGAVGDTKRKRLDEIQDEARQRRQGIEVTQGVNNALEVAEAIINRAGVPDSPVKEDLIHIIRRALNMFVSDPAKWQNGQTAFFANKRKKNA